MALSDMVIRITDEISRADLSSQALSEISSAITFYQNERFWFNENTMITLTTIQGQREYTLPPNFAAILDVRSQQGNLKYMLEPATVQYLDTIDWGNNLYIASYLERYALYNGKIRVFPAPISGLPLYIKGTVILPSLTTTAATGTYAQNTAFTAGDTILDPNGNIQTAKTSGTTGAAVTQTYTANTAYAVNDTILDGNGNTQTCSTAGTSGYILAVDKTQWGTEVNGITTDGTSLQWTLTSQMWSTDYNSYTVDGSVVWQLTTALTNPWMVQAEELIRTRTIRMLYQRYIKDMEQAGSYAGMEQELLKNLQRKNVGQTALNRIRSHI